MDSESNPGLRDEGRAPKNGSNHERARRMAGTLEKDAALNAALWNTVSSLIAVFDRIGRIVRFNKAAELATGYRAEEVVGKHVWEVLSQPEDVPKVKAFFESVAQATFPHVHEDYWITKGGDRIRISFKGAALAGRDGSVEFIVCTGMDVTEARRKEEALRTSETQLRCITDNMTDLVAKLDSKGVMTFASPSFQTLGYGPDGLVGKAVFDLVHPEDLEGVLGFINVHLKNPTVCALKEFRLRQADGSFVWVEATGRAVFEDGVASRVMSARVITKRKMVEEGLRRRTEEAENAKLRAQTYLDFMSHDILNILSPIRAYAELIQQEKETGASASKHAQKILTQVDLVSGFIRNVRKLSMVEQGGAKSGHVDVRGVITQCIEELVAQNPGKTLNFSVKAPDGDLLVPGEGIVEDMIAEVLGNAVEHAGRDDVAVEVAVTADGGQMSGPAWTLSVSDNGPGIPDDRKREVTLEALKAGEPLQRGIMTSLVFIHLIVEGLGGQMRLEDRVQGDHAQGSRVVIRLPRS